MDIHDRNASLSAGQSKSVSRMLGRFVVCRSDKNSACDLCSCSQNGKVRLEVNVE